MKQSTLYEKISEAEFDHLTTKELHYLQRLNLGYGNFTANAEACGLYINTYRTILERGYGRPANIEKIRKKLLS